MDSLAAIPTLNLILAASVMVVMWAVSVRLNDVSIVDIAWGGTGALLALSAFLTFRGDPVRSLLLTSMTVLWGVRLSVHIARRKGGKGEDFRYAAMRAAHPETFPRRSLITVFLLQAVLIWVISLPAQLAQLQPMPDRVTALDALGVVVWVIGFGMEAIADRQLARFLAHPANRGQVMDKGLWRYSRHPNYFGDSLVWWGIWLVAASTPGGWMTLFSPVLMTFFLTRVSGVPLLEEALAERREGYRSYMARTSAFFPWPPREPGSGG